MIHAGFAADSASTGQALSLGCGCGLEDSSSFSMVIVFFAVAGLMSCLYVAYEVIGWCKCYRELRMQSAASTTPESKPSMRVLVKMKAVIVNEVFVAASIASATRSYHFSEDCVAMNHATQPKSASMCRFCARKVKQCHHKKSSLNQAHNGRTAKWTSCTWCRGGSCFLLQNMLNDSCWLL